MGTSQEESRPPTHAIDVVVSASRSEQSNGVEFSLGIRACAGIYATEKKSISGSGSRPIVSLAQLRVGSG